MTARPLHMWIAAGRVVGVGDTRRDAFRDALNILTGDEESLVQAFNDALGEQVPEELLSEMEKDVERIRSEGYGVKVRFSHYKNGEDPRTALYDTLIGRDDEQAEALLDEDEDEDRWEDDSDSIPMMDSVEFGDLDEEQDADLIAELVRRSEAKGAPKNGTAKAKAERDHRPPRAAPQSDRKG